MKYLLLGCASVALIIGSNNANAQDLSSYVSGKIGFTKTSDSDWSDSGSTGDIGVSNAVNFAAAYGLNVTPEIRTEFEISYRKADLDDITVDGVGSADLSGDVKTWGFMINGYYDFMKENVVSPYVTAGIGALRHKGKIDAVGGLGVSAVKGDDTTFAYQLGFGAAYDLSEKVALDGGYRYLGGSDIKISTSSFEYDAHELRVGLRYNF